MGNFITKIFDHKIKQGLLAVLVLCLLSFVLNTVAKNRVSEDVRISVTVFTVAAGCVLGLKILVSRMHQKSE